MASMTRDEIIHAFTYHPPHGDQSTRYGRLRTKGKYFAESILQTVPDCRERSMALSRLREAVMWANAGIACSEPEPPNPEPRAD